MVSTCSSCEKKQTCVRLFALIGVPAVGAVYRAGADRQGAGSRGGPGHHGAGQLGDGASRHRQPHPVQRRLQDADGLLVGHLLVQGLAVDGQDLVGLSELPVAAEGGRTLVKVREGRAWRLTTPHVPVSHASGLDLLDEDAQLPVVLALQADHAEAQTSGLRLLQLHVRHVAPLEHAAAQYSIKARGNLQKSI